MPDSIRRQQILDSIRARLSTISGIKAAYDWRPQTIDASGLPCIVVRDTETQTVTDAASNAGYRGIRMTVEIIILVSGSSAATSIRSYMDSVIGAIGIDSTFDRICTKVTVDGDTVEMDHEDKIYAMATIKLSVYYHVGRWNT